MADKSFIKLHQFLKWKGLTDTGGQAKQVIQTGQIRVNGEIETRRGRKLTKGDVVEWGPETWVVPPLVGAAAVSTERAGA